MLEVQEEKPATHQISKMIIKYACMNFSTNKVVPLHTKKSYKLVELLVNAKKAFQTSKWHFLSQAIYAYVEINFIWIESNWLDEFHV